MGGELIEGIIVFGKFYCVWMDVKSVFISKDCKVVFNFCEFGEDVVVKIYEFELEGDVFGFLVGLV